MIKELCGSVSFKRGEALFRANKVTIDQDDPKHCEAIVTGIEDFHVTIEENEIGGFRTNCSCPSLASYQKDCQHIAAVLLFIHEHQHRGKIPQKMNIDQVDSSDDQEFTKSILTLFNDQLVRSSSQQLHFENRKILDVEFICKLITIGKGRQMLGIEVKIGPIKVQNIQDFIEHVRNGELVYTFAFIYIRSKSPLFSRRIE